MRQGAYYNSKDDLILEVGVIGNMAYIVRNEEDDSYMLHDAQDLEDGLRCLGYEYIGSV